MGLRVEGLIARIGFRGYVAGNPLRKIAVLVQAPYSRLQG